MQPVSFECNICSEDFKDPHVTPCGHTYCNPCISTWIKTHKNCPECRKLVESTAPNYFVKNLMEGAAKKVEEVAKPPIADANSQELAEPLIERTVKSTAKMKLVEEKVTEPSIAVVNAAPKEPEGPPLSVHITVFNFETGETELYQMPQCEEIVTAIAACRGTGEVPKQQLEGKKVPAKIDCLILHPYINVKNFLSSNEVAEGESPTKTFKEIRALEFHDGVVGLTAENRTLYYRMEDNSFREAYQNALKPKEIQDAITNTLLTLLYQPNSLQAVAGDVPNDFPRELVMEALHELIRKNLNNPNAQFTEILELDNLINPALKTFVGICYERPVLNPKPKPEPKPKEDPPFIRSFTFTVDQFMNDPELRENILSSWIPCNQGCEH